MEVNLNTIQIVSPKDNFSSLEKVTEKNFVYKFFLDVSKNSVLSTNANKIVLRTYEKDPKNEVAISIFNSPENQTLNVLNLNSSQLVSNIKRRNYRLLNDITKTRENYLTVNDYNLNELVKFYNNGVGYTLVDPNKTKKSIRNFVYNSEISLPEEFVREDRTYQQLNLELLYQNKIDPATILKRIYSRNTAYETNNGVLQATNFNNNSFVENTILTSLIYKEFNNSEFRPEVQTYNIEERDIITIQIDSELPIAILSNKDFYAMFSVYNINNELIQEFVKFVPHKNNLEFFKKVKKAPLLIVNKFSEGYLSIFLQQLDKNATGVNLYKTVYNPTNNNDAIVQEFIGSYNLEPDEIKIINLQNNSYGITLFRAVAYNNAGHTCSDFSSSIIEYYPNNKTNSNKENCFISLKSEYVSNGLNITLNDFPSDIAYVNLYKADITEDLNAPRSILTTILVGGNGSFSTYGFLDVDLQSYKKYRYTCDLTDIKGQKYDSSANLEIYYRPINKSYATVTVTPPNILPIQLSGNSTQHFDVSFSLSYAINNNLEDDVKTLLSEQGLLDYYGGDIDRNKLKKLLVTKIELRDLNTNDFYFLGFFSTVFSQAATYFGLLTKPSKYVYTLTTYFRDPKTLLETIVETENSTPRANSKITPPSYTYVPFNINNPYGLLTGTYPKKSGNEFVKQYGLSQLSLGDITSIIEIPINLDPPIPVINNFKAVLFNSRNVELNWSINGSQGEISHFIIRRENIQTGNIDLIGKAHGINVQNAYSFIDPIRYTESGVFRYIITMQYTDLSISSDFYSNEVVI